MSTSNRARKVVACLIVRMKSTRLQRKALADICGQPMIVRIINRLKTAETLDEIVLCTSTHPDDQILLDVAEQCGIPSLAGSEADVLSRFLDVIEEYHADVIVRVTGDNVFVDSPTIDRMVEHQLITGADYIRTEGMPWGTTAEVMSTSMMKQLPELIPDPNISGYLTLWAFDPERFYCQALPAPESIKRPNYSLTVDTPEDIALARRLFEALPSIEAGPSLENIVAVLDKDPSYSGIPQDAIIKLPKGETTTFGEFKAWLAERARIANKRSG